ncbi:hypothetical protein CJU89_6703 [Yarrowia sp. B02]|nr:hypothetical protein CJU89_6703 [Yarrowia sp. B02]
MNTDIDQLNSSELMKITCQIDAERAQTEDDAKEFVRKLEKDVCVLQPVLSVSASQQECTAAAQKLKAAFCALLDEHKAEYDGFVAKLQKALLQTEKIDKGCVQLIEEEENAHEREILRFDLMLRNSDQFVFWKVLESARQNYSHLEALVQSQLLKMVEGQLKELQERF